MIRVLAAPLTVSGFFPGESFQLDHGRCGAARNMHFQGAMEEIEPRLVSTPDEVTHRFLTVCPVRVVMRTDVRNGRMQGVLLLPSLLDASGRV